MGAGAGDGLRGAEHEEGAHPRGAVRVLHARLLVHGERGGGRLCAEILRGHRGNRLAHLYGADGPLRHGKLGGPAHAALDLPGPLIGYSGRYSYEFLYYAVFSFFTAVAFLCGATHVAGQTGASAATFFMFVVMGTELGAGF